MPHWRHLVGNSNQCPLAPPYSRALRTRELNTYLNAVYLQYGASSKHSALPERPISRLLSSACNTVSPTLSAGNLASYLHEKTSAKMGSILLDGSTSTPIYQPPASVLFCSAFLSPWVQCCLCLCSGSQHLSESQYSLL